jgi:hypothetical protein
MKAAVAAAGREVSELKGMNLFSGAFLSYSFNKCIHKVNPIIVLSILLIESSG